MNIFFYQKKINVVNKYIRTKKRHIFFIDNISLIFLHLH